VRSRSLLGALAGVLAAFVALGVGEFVAVFVRPAAAPLVAVGNRVITLTPESTKRSAIQSFGTDDKTVLLWTLVAAIVVFGAVVGTLALSNVWYGVAGVGVFGAFGVYCSLTQNAAQGTDAIPSVVATLAGAGILWLLMHLLGTPAETASDGTDRRRFLAGTAATAGLAAITGFGGRAAIHARFDVETKRRKVALPKPVSPARPLARGTDLGRSGVPFVTPADDFYKIDTTLELPQVDPASWSLRIHGKVDHEVTLSYAQLLRRPMLERWITLCCVSNEVGGPLISNARWLGVRLADVLREAGVHSDADQLLMTSVEGMTIGAPTKVVMDGRDALIAVGMNGEPLPVAHGFPARIVVPGLYGYVSACKWVVDIEATTFADNAAYWVQGGWTSGQAETGVKLQSRIDTPRSGARVHAGRPVVVAGVAWDQHVGVSKVEVQVDDGPWQTARLAAVPSTDTWRQWVAVWTPPHAGSYTVRVRATDAAGKPQVTAGSDVYPSGATGLHQITVRAA
jgi:DMSO/TMAO reductase YedYZ molybdopterin-dependent catalytic subunit